MYNGNNIMHDRGPDSPRTRALIVWQDPANHTALRPGMPMLVMYGDADPVPVPPTGGHAVSQVQEELRAAGKTLPKVISYPDARHEIFNEVNREEVTADLVAWLRDAFDGKFAVPTKSGVKSRL